ncbi:MAG: chromate transporter [Treponema sp.]|nr:chromate transporter [Treponema sp.]
MSNVPSLLLLFGIFFYVGLFTIGGGLVAITLMQQTLVSRGYITQESFYNMVAISESTPGPIGMNMATYIGNEFYGVPGAIITTSGQVLPSLICILIIAHFFSKFQEKPIIKAAFSTLRPATTGIILIATAQVFSLALLNIPTSITVLATVSGWIDLFKWPSVAFYVVSLIALFKTKLHPVVIIAAGAIFGILCL